MHTPTTPDVWKEGGLVLDIENQRAEETGGEEMADEVVAEETPDKDHLARQAEVGGTGVARTPLVPLRRSRLHQGHPDPR